MIHLSRSVRNKRSVLNNISFSFPFVVHVLTATHFGFALMSTHYLPRVFKKQSWPSAVCYLTSIMQLLASILAQHKSPLSRLVSPSASQVVLQRHFLPGDSRATSASGIRHLNVASRPSDLVGHTPLLDLTKILKAHGINNGCKLYGKMESMEPCSSVKDRIGRSMIDAAEAEGKLKPGKSVLVEPTSGNTGIALAFIARERGYRCILTMPETMSLERRMMLLALGAEVVLTPKETAVAGALAKAIEILDTLNGDGVMLQQFENPANPKVHRETTGPEIWEDTDGLIDMFISGVGTGGTLTGVSQFLKGSDELGLAPKNPNLITIGVEPQEQMLLTAAKGGEKIGEQGPHKIQGMGAGIIPAILDLNLIDEVVPVHSEKAMETTKELWEMGIPVGVSSGAIVNASIQVCGREESKDKVAVCIIPSFGERYFTHPMFDSIKKEAEGLTKQPLPPPYDNRDFGFATERGDAQ